MGSTLWGTQLGRKASLFALISGNSNVALGEQSLFLGYTVPLLSEMALFLFPRCLSLPRRLQRGRSCSSSRPGVGLAITIAAVIIALTRETLLNNKLSENMCTAVQYKLQKPLVCPEPL